MPAKGKSRAAHRTLREEDSLADVKPLTLAEFEDAGDDAVEIVLRGAALFDRSTPYRERLMRAVRFYLRSDSIPYVVMALNKRIASAAADKRREDAKLKVTDPDWSPPMQPKPVGGRT
jgi:hypothetical protein